MAQEPLTSASRSIIAAALLLAALASLAACEKTTTTTTTPTGSVTTTTISPSLPASEAIDKLRETLAKASAPSFGAAASRVDAEAGRAAARAGEAIEDGVVSTKVKAAFLVDPDVKGMSIQVETHDGVVTLSGSAAKAADASRAAASHATSRA